MDLKSRELWVEYSKAKDEMFHYTDTKQSPWWVVEADDKRARLHRISHLLGRSPRRPTLSPSSSRPPRQRLCPPAPDRPDLVPNRYS